MVCPEKIRLQQLYNAAIRRWAQVTSSQLFARLTYLTEEERKRALAERNAAKARLTGHQQNFIRHCCSSSFTGVKVTFSGEQPLSDLPGIAGERTPALCHLPFEPSATGAAA
jgi:hypothetical protein